MDPGLLWGGLACLYVVPTVIVLVRRPTMPLFVIALDLLVGWSIVGWAAALFLALTFPRKRDLRAAALPAAGVAAPLSVAGSGDPRSATFLRDPLTVGVLTGIGSGAYYLWWFWQFFTFAKRERFPRARSFWWIFVPLYGLAVVFRTLEDLEMRMPQPMRGRFSARTAFGLFIAGNGLAAFAVRLPEPAGIGLYLLGGAFLGAAIYVVQRAVNSYLYAAYPGRVPKATSFGEVCALLIGICLLGLSVAGATLTLKVQQRKIDEAAAVLGTPSPIRPTPTPNPHPSAGPFPVSGNGLLMTSEPGDRVGGGVPRTYDQSTATFRVQSTTPSQGVYLKVGSIDQSELWDFVFEPPQAQILHVGTYDVPLATPLSGREAGLGLSGDGRYCSNLLTGSFTITRITYDPNGRLMALDLTFVMRCDRSDAPALRGWLRFDQPPAG